MTTEEIRINYEASVVNRGNQTRLKEVFRRAKNGEKLTLGFLGGSITQGSLATRPELCYAYHVYEWVCNSSGWRISYLNRLPCIFPEHDNCLSMSLQKIVRYLKGVLIGKLQSRCMYTA